MNYISFQYHKLPHKWDYRKLKHICRFAYGDSLPAEEREDGQYNVYGSNGVVGNHAIANTRKPTIIIGRKGSYGKLNYSENETFAIDTTYYIDNRFTAQSIRWLFYALQPLELDKGSKDSAVPGLSREDVYDDIIPTPPLPIQKAIAAYLDKETARIDALIAKKERQIELLQEKRQAIITRAITKGLEPKVKMKDSGVEWIGEIPEGWEVKKLKYITTKIGSGKTPKGGATVYQDSGILLLRSQNIHFNGLRLDDVAYIDEDADSEMLNTRVLPDDVLLNITGASIGRSFYIPKAFPKANVNQHVCIVRPKHNRIMTEFLWMALCSDLIQNLIRAGENGTSREGLTFEQIANFIIPYPMSIDEQEKVIGKATALILTIDGTVEKIENSISLLREYRSSLITAAVSGQIDVSQKVAQ
jgi:type I restriction enzyme S subunit